MPRPDSATLSGPPGALVATVRVPVALPPVVGANVTCAVQEPPAARELPQLLVCVNGPVALIPDSAAALVPGFVTVTDCGALVEPEFTSPNDRLLGVACRAPGCTGSGKAVSTG